MCVCVQLLLAGHIDTDNEGEKLAFVEGGRGWGVPVISVKDIH